MPKKRKNGGKSRHNRGNVRSVVCDATGKRVPKDKAIKRFYSKPMFDPTTLKDLKDACYYDKYKVPRLHKQQKFCVSEAQYHKVIKKRPKWERKDDNIPEQVKRAQIAIGRVIDTMQHDNRTYLFSYRGNRDIWLSNASKLRKVMYND